jgi:beta-lactamase regulating signal transducer with metallopeptidase domain
MNSLWLHLAASALMHFVWQGAALALVLLAAVKALNVQAARTRYLMSVGTFFAMAVAPVLTIGVSRYDADGWTTPATAAGPIRISAAEGPGVIASAEREHGLARSDRRPARVEFYVLSLWLAGVAVFGARLAIGCGFAWWIRHDSLPLPAGFEPCVRRVGFRLRLDVAGRVLLCRRIGHSVAVGFIRPVVLIPAAWLSQLPPEVIEAAIAHELAHIRRWDLWINLFQRLVESLLFYHPAIWWLSRRIRLEREMCCDEIAFEFVGRAAYARSLESIAAISAGELLIGASILEGNKMNLLHRIRHVLGTETCQATSNCCAAGFVAMIFLFAAAAALTPESEPLGAAVKADQSQKAAPPATPPQAPGVTKAAAAPARGKGSAEPDREIARLLHRFDALMQEEKWDAAETLATEAAKRFGERDAIIQTMLLDSLNAKRRIQGLPLIRIQYLTPNEDAKAVWVYQIKDLPLWSRDGGDQNADLLIKYIMATVDPPSWRNGESRAIYNAKRFELLVSTSTENSKKVKKLLGELRSKEKAPDKPPTGNRPSK